MGFPVWHWICHKKISIILLVGKNNTTFYCYWEGEGSSERGHDELSSADVLLDTKCMSLHMAHIWIKGDRTAEKKISEEEQNHLPTPWQALLIRSSNPTHFPWGPLPAWTILSSSQKGRKWTWVHSGLNWLAVMSLRARFRVQFAPSVINTSFPLFLLCAKESENRD